ncbi:hypothetical protein AVEN_118015-1 [Araneus ventricosus]|uniref:Uncharacterized protein n=1 Tax=Araneus ventricosus TaxID=182803 RepID=A0A4Y2C9E0_ARAVE|nr:hypothetical protein AVEN_118015-1 [Araneus ventricosus]
MARNHVPQKREITNVYDVHHSRQQTPLSLTQRISWIKPRPTVSWQLTRGLTKPLWTIGWNGTWRREMYDVFGNNMVYVKRALNHYGAGTEDVFAIQLEESFCFT